MSELPNPEYLRSILSYDPDNGNLTWKPRPLDHFVSQRGCSTWNTRFAGKPAFTALSAGYRIGAVDYQTLKAHRVAWAIYHGEWPEGQIDHIDGDRANNQMVNLRVVDHQENARNQQRRADNTSGVTGVSYAQKERRWYACIRKDGRTIPLGTFVSKELAIAARQAADQRLGFHPNHGRIAA